MARNAFWRGYLKLSLVNCPVTMMPATSESEKIRFHTINRKSGRRVRSQYVDSDTGEVVRHEVKGYETEEGKFVTFEDEELEAVALDSVRTVDIDSFVPADSIPWIWYDSPYYVVPSDKVGEEAFAVIREAMREKDVVGISRLVLNRRERAVLLEPRGNGIILWTLRYGDEVRDPGEFFKDIDPARADSKLVNMVGELIEERSKPWTPKMVEDPVQEKLRDIIAAKNRKGKSTAKAKADAEPEGASNVVSLMDALKKSLEKNPSSARKGSSRKS
ncbi:Ku protein [Mesorhizobium australicum]|uniref:Non-homologous end joining protein Ku n=1 Tax=Mesorhizobium australicum TaxID=536018 RepID=A0A1X7PQB9_9HYPH|nr:Ku protein [Mesorhizobium australicum]SMH53965.1 DNA end-binding protein Ku [Mesorhizobium australicum]